MLKLDNKKNNSECEELFNALPAIEKNILDLKRFILSMNRKSVNTPKLIESIQTNHKNIKERIDYFIDILNQKRCFLGEINDGMHVSYELQWTIKMPEGREMEGYGGDIYDYALYWHEIDKIKASKILKILKEKQVIKKDSDNHYCYFIPEEMIDYKKKVFNVHGIEIPF